MTSLTFHSSVTSQESPDSEIKRANITCLVYSYDGSGRLLGSNKSTNPTYFFGVKFSVAMAMTMFGTHLRCPHFSIPEIPILVTNSASALPGFQYRLTRCYRGFPSLGPLEAWTQEVHYGDFGIFVAPGLFTVT